VPEILGELAAGDPLETVLHAGTRYLATTAKARGLADRIVESRPSLFFDGKGDLQLLYVEGDAHGHRIRVRGVEKPISSTDAFDAVAAGRFVFWVGLAASGKYDVFAKRWPDGKPVNLTDSDDDAMDPAATIAADGSVWVAYTRWRKMGTVSRDKEVYARRFDGKSWSAEIRLSPDDVPVYEDHTDPAIAPDGKDGVAVAWAWDMHRMRDPKYARYQTSYHAEAPTIFGRRATASGAESLLFFGHRGIDGTPGLFRDRAGRLHCAWRTLTYGRTGEGKALIVSRLAADAPDRADQRVVEEGRRDAAAPFFYVNNGVLHLVWSSQAEDGRWTIRRSRLEKGVWTKPEDLVAEGNPRESSVAISKWWQVLLAYAKDDGPHRRIVLKTIGKEYS
jgi:hypothetical protein